jgi:protease YdgD
VTGCASSHPGLSFAVEQRILRETTLDDMPEGAAEVRPGDGVVRVVNMGGGRCSGALVGPRHVMTAAHCIMRHDSHRELVLSQVNAGDLHVELGGNYLPWGRVGVRRLHTCDGYVGDAEHDLAVLVLSRPVPGEVAKLDLSYDVPDEAVIYELAGFGSKEKPRIIPETMWAVTSIERHVFRGPVTLVSDHIINVAVSASPGDSGGPIVDTATGRLVSVASHGRSSDDWSATGWKEGSVNGPRLLSCKKAIDEAFAR